MAQRVLQDQRELPVQSVLQEPPGQRELLAQREPQDLQEQQAILE